MTEYRYTDKGYGELIDTHQVAKKVFGEDTPVNRRKLFKLIKDKRFPKPITMRPIKNSDTLNFFPRAMALDNKISAPFTTSNKPKNNSKV